MNGFVTPLAKGDEVFVALGLDPLVGHVMNSDPRAAAAKPAFEVVPLECALLASAILGRV
jgi:hypothetical protein